MHEQAKFGRNLLHKGFFDDGCQSGRSVRSLRIKPLPYDANKMQSPDCIGVVANLPSSPCSTA